MVVDEVKKEATGKRPSALSEWYRRKLGRDVAISDIDWVITSISNKNISNRYLIIEEKTISNTDKLLVGLGQARSLKEVKQDIVKVNIPVFVVFIKNNDVSNGVWLYEFKIENIDDKSNWCKIGMSWYVDVKKYAEFFKEDELVNKLLGRVGSVLK
tara:strand:+ start:1558 stop:2025 length:468 start_codon:yes stop_codon:yes gene_type:complete